MDKFELKSNESVILRESNVQYSGFLSGYTDDLILTNLNVIHVKKGLLGNTKNVTYFPLKKLKIFDGKAQVKIGKHSNGLHRLEFYFEDGQEYFIFQAGTSIKGLKWLKEINYLLSKDVAESSQVKGEKYADSPLDKKIKGVIKNISGNIGNKKIMSCNCPSCGALLTGAKGTSVVCEYCNSSVIMKS